MKGMFIFAMQIMFYIAFFWFGIICFKIFVKENTKVKETYFRKYIYKGPKHMQPNDLSKLSNKSCF